MQLINNKGMDWIGLDLIDGWWHHILYFPDREGLELESGVDINVLFRLHHMMIIKLQEADKFDM